MRVTLYEATSEVPKGMIIATLRLTNGQVRAEPAPGQADMVTRLLADPIGWYRKDQPTVPITATSHPREFLLMLEHNYRGSHFWAGPPTED